MKIAPIKTVGIIADGLFVLHNNNGGDGMYYPYGRQEVIRVNGRNGADAYQMPPNSSVLLLDETAPIIWLKTTDGASYPTVTGYEIKPMVDKQTSLEERIERLERMFDEKSNDTGAEQKRNTKRDKQYKESDDE